MSFLSELFKIGELSKQCVFNIFDNKFYYINQTMYAILYIAIIIFI
jgi:hypothetical protein